MLFVHEVHRVAGRGAHEFETLYREGWLPALGKTDDARLVWFLHQGHGTGPAYTWISITAVASAAALADLDDRVRRGDLREWQRDVDALRHDAVAKVLEPVPWSPMTSLDLAAVPVDAVDHGPNLPLFMEDTAWPHPGRLDDYLEKAGSLYLRTLEKAAEMGANLLDLVAAFTPFFGTGKATEVVLWQRVAKPEFLLPLLNREVPPEYEVPGTWMHDALDVRDRWESRLLRVAPWSPLG
jgi:hypothetical protein